jgi:hypothetical protein
MQEPVAALGGRIGQSTVLAGEFGLEGIDLVVGLCALPPTNGECRNESACRCRSGQRGDEKFANSKRQKRSRSHENTNVFWTRGIQIHARRTVQQRMGQGSAPWAAKVGLADVESVTTRGAQNQWAWWRFAVLGEPLPDQTLLRRR